MGRSTLANPSLSVKQHELTAESGVRQMLPVPPIEGDADKLGLWFRPKPYPPTHAQTVEILNGDIHYVYGIEFQQRGSLGVYYLYTLFHVVLDETVRFPTEGLATIKLEVNAISFDLSIKFDVNSICIEWFRVDVVISIVHVATYDCQLIYIKPEAFTYGYSGYPFLHHRFWFLNPGALRLCPKLYHYLCVIAVKILSGYYNLMLGVVFQRIVVTPVPYIQEVCFIPFSIGRVLMEGLVVLVIEPNLIPIKGFGKYKAYSR